MLSYHDVGSTTLVLGLRDENTFRAGHVLAIDMVQNCFLDELAISLKLIISVKSWQRGRIAAVILLPDLSGLTLQHALRDEHHECLQGLYLAISIQ